MTKTQRAVYTSCILLLILSVQPVSIDSSGVCRQVFACFLVDTLMSVS